MDTARGRGRYGHRDATMILIAYRHGLRAGELCALRWDQVDLEHGLLHVWRVKNGMASVHPMGGTEIRALRPQARATGIAARLSHRATCANDNGGVSEDDYTDIGGGGVSVSGASAHAATCVRV